MSAARSLSADARTEMLDRLGRFASTPRAVLDIGGGVTGDDAGLRALRALFPRAQIGRAHV